MDINLLSSKYTVKKCYVKFNPDFWEAVSRIMGHGRPLEFDRDGPVTK